VGLQSTVSVDCAKVFSKTNTVSGGTSEESTSLRYSSLVETMLYRLLRDFHVALSES
jgi:hypothetical protein